MTIYFVQQGDSGCIKIGYTSQDVQSRIKQLSTSSPEPLNILGILQGRSRHDEKHIHNMFEAYRTSGEWFSPAPEIIEFIQRNKGLQSPFQGLETRWGKQLGFNAILSSKKRDKTKDTQSDHLTNDTKKLKPKKRQPTKKNGILIKPKQLVKSERSICQGITRKGNPCKQKVVRGSLFCGLHQSQADGIPDDWILPINKKERPTICKGVTRSGAPCKQKIARGSAFCPCHRNQINGIPDDWVLSQRCRGITGKGNRCSVYLPKGVYCCARHNNQKNFFALFLIRKFFVKLYLYVIG